MKMNRSSTKGFTLVEIMIVVVIIGLLAAMALPAFQKVRRESLAKTMANDARQIGSAAQQIATEYSGILLGNTTMTLGANTASGAVTSGAVAGNIGIPVNAVTEYVSRVSKGYTAVSDYTFGGNATGVGFTITHPQVSPTSVIKQSTVNTSSTAGTAVAFDPEGRAL